MARITVAVEGGCAIICLVLFALYWGLLWPTKRAHDKEIKEKQERRSLQSNTDEEKDAEGYGSEAKAESRSPTIAKARPSRQGTTRSDRTTKSDSPVASKRISELKVAPAPTEEEVGNEDQPDIILTPKMPPFDHTLTGVTKVDDPPEEQS
jgi:hypothetical protein